MKAQILTLYLLLTTANYALADSIGYADSLRLKIESRNFIIIHFHNWTNATRNARYKMISTDQNPFSASNNYAYIECIDKRSGKTVFKKPCSALTQIIISPDEKYILGISKIMLWNPYQLVIFSITGQVLKKRHIRSEESKMPKSQFEKFKRDFPSQYAFLNNNGNVYYDSGCYFIDFLSMNMPGNLKKAWTFLYQYLTPNHLSGNFSESVTNWVFWYNEENPDIEFGYNQDNLVSMSILDPKQRRISIRLREE